MLFHVLFLLGIAALRPDHVPSMVFVWTCCGAAGGITASLSEIEHPSTSPTRG